MFGRKNIIIILLLTIIFLICFNVFTYATDETVGLILKAEKIDNEVEQSKDINFTGLFINVAMIISIINLIISSILYKKNNSKEPTIIICKIMFLVSLVSEYLLLGGAFSLGVWLIEGMTESEFNYYNNHNMVKNILFNSITLIYLLAQIIIFIYLLVKIIKKSETK